MVNRDGSGYARANGRQVRARGRECDPVWVAQMAGDVTPGCMRWSDGVAVWIVYRVARGVKWLFPGRSQGAQTKLRRESGAVEESVDGGLIMPWVAWCGVGDGSVCR